MDLVAEGRTIWQPSADYTETGFLVEAGYYLTPELRLSAGYVFGEADDEDFTGTRSSDGAYFGMTVKLNGLLDGFGQHSPPTLPKEEVDAPSPQIWGRKKPTVGWANPKPPTAIAQDPCPPNLGRRRRSRG